MGRDDRSRRVKPDTLCFLALPEWVVFSFVLRRFITLSAPLTEHTPTSLSQNGMPAPSSLLAFGTGSAFASLPPSKAVELVREALRLGIRRLDLAEAYGNQAALGTLFHELWGKGAVLPAGMPRREEVTITTKIWPTNMHPRNVGPALDATVGASVVRARRSAAADVRVCRRRVPRLPSALPLSIEWLDSPCLRLPPQLEDLRLSHVDAWLIHWPAALAFAGDVRGPARGEMFPRVGAKTAYATGVALRDVWAAMEAEVLAGKARHLGLCNTPPAMLHDLAASGPHAVWPPVVVS